ncbi:hypothetical protein BC936DRAFT_147801 [Jimgerdemannia flammicorona]|uniref:Uncharacterized protein n=2 Tax=Jimgerdemannia flammicorona TaxID=994334 RepID=A0A433D4F3_9FUNG|nr:hypothetical protein BC936DRAFT_147801 [Jimgerdemannia flammicorona]RUS33601.1 hypothetical protein BC938DRAFT_470937 [Jimgerdemannia flammicorona]
MRCVAGPRAEAVSLDGSLGGVVTGLADGDGLSERDGEGVRVGLGGVREYNCLTASLRKDLDFVTGLAYDDHDVRVQIRRRGSSAHDELLCGSGLTVKMLQHGDNIMGCQICFFNAIPSSNNHDLLPRGLYSSGNIQEQGVPRAGVVRRRLEDGHTCNGVGEQSDQVCVGPRAVESDTDEAYACVRVVANTVDGVLHNGCASAHGDDDGARVRVATVLEREVSATREVCEAMHDVADGGGNGGGCWVNGWFLLVAEVCRSRGCGCAGFESGAVGCDVCVGEELRQDVCGEEIDVCGLCGDAAGVEEVEEGCSRDDGGGVGDGGEVLGFLNGGGGEECKACLANGHDVGKVAEGGRVGRAVLGRDVDDQGGAIGGHLVEVRNRCQEGTRGSHDGDERAGGQRLVKARSWVGLRREGVNLWSCVQEIGGVGLGEAGESVGGGGGCLMCEHEDIVARCVGDGRGGGLTVDNIQAGHSD